MGNAIVTRNDFPRQASDFALITDMRLTLADATEAGTTRVADPGFPAEIAMPPAIHSLEKRRLQCYLILLIGDLAALAAGFVYGSLLMFGAGDFAHALTQAQILAPLYLTFGLYMGAYSLSALRKPPESLAKPLRALLAAAVMMAVLTYFSKTSWYFSRLVFVSGLSVSAALIGLWRVAAQPLIRWRCGSRVENFLVIMDGGPPVAIGDAHVIDAAQHGLRPDINDPLALDRLGSYCAGMDRVLVSSSVAARGEWALTLKGLAVDGEVVDPSVEALGALGARRVGGQGFLVVSHRPLGLRDRAVKRAFDLALAVPALIALSPLMLAVLLAIKLEDGGPGLFVQRRTGRASRFFRIYKFRSMRLASADATGTRSASPDDDRVTRIGRLIRRTSIDELPQLLNVVKGDMSLVGPRPHAIGSQAGDKLFWEVDQRYWQRHTLKPGLTGLAQIRGFRGATDTERDLVERLQADLEYLDGWSIWRDVGIIFGTLRVMVHARAF